MSNEYKKWFLQAEEDLDTAKKNLEIKKYYVVAFYCQQSVEKALKSVILSKKKDKIIAHSLIFLGKEASVPKDFFSGLKLLSPQYIISRYPDASEESPSELYDEEIVSDFLKTAQKVLKWVKNQLK